MAEASAPFRYHAPDLPIDTNATMNWTSAVTSSSKIIHPHDIYRRQRGQTRSKVGHPFTSKSTCHGMVTRHDLLTTDA